MSSNKNIGLMRYVDWASGLLIEKKQERNFRFVSVIPEKAGFENKFKSGFSGIFDFFIFVRCIKVTEFTAYHITIHSYR